MGRLAAQTPTAEETFGTSNFFLEAAMEMSLICFHWARPSRPLRERRLAFVEIPSKKYSNCVRRAAQGNEKAAVGNFPPVGYWPSTVSRGVGHLHNLNLRGAGAYRGNWRRGTVKHIYCTHPAQMCSTECGTRGRAHEDKGLF